MITTLKIVLALVCGASVAILVAGQLGLFAGSVPKNLGVRDGRLKPPSKTPNSVSSQAGLHPDHPMRAHADIEPFRYAGDGAAALARLAAIVEAQPRTRIVTQEAGYVYAQCRTALLKFTDDLELWLDEPAKVIQVRSSSRIGRKDFGVNRARVEALREKFNQDRP